MGWSKDRANVEAAQPSRKECVYFTVSDKKRIRRGFRTVEGDWRRVDLHLHTPASADWQEPGVTYLEWLQKAESRGLDIVAITDHNTVEGIARLRADIERLTWLRPTTGYAHRSGGI